MVSSERTALYGLLAANAASLLGNTVAAVAIPWFVLTTTGSAARTGVAAFFTTVPLALGALFGGAVAERVGPKRASVAGDLLSAVSLAAIPMLLAAELLEFWHLLALTFLGSLFDGPSQAARQALVPDLAAQAGMPLERANALHNGTEHIGYIVGAPLAGVLVATIGAPNALWVDSASFVLAAVVLGVSVTAAGRRAAPRRHYVAELVEGLRFVAREPVVRSLLVLPTVGNFFISPLGPVVLPVYAREELSGSGAFGALMAAYGVGGILGIALYGVLGPRLPRRPIYVALALFYPAVSFFLIALPPLWPALATLALLGVSAGGVVPLFQTVRQERTPPELRARVFATVAAAEAMAIPPAVLLAGLALETLGLRAALLAFVVGNTLYSALKLGLPAGRDLEPRDTTMGAGSGGRRHPGRAQLCDQKVRDGRYVSTTQISAGTANSEGRPARQGQGTHAPPSGPQPRLALARNGRQPEATAPRRRR
jgi:MFS family permease